MTHDGPNDMLRESNAGVPCFAAPLKLPASRQQPCFRHESADLIWIQGFRRSRFQALSLPDFRFLRKVSEFRARILKLLGCGGGQWIPASRGLWRALHMHMGPHARALVRNATKRGCIDTCMLSLCVGTADFQRLTQQLPC